MWLSYIPLPPSLQCGCALSLLFYAESLLDGLALSIPSRLFCARSSSSGVGVESLWLLLTSTCSQACSTLPLPDIMHYMHFSNVTVNCVRVVHTLKILCSFIYEEMYVHNQKPNLLRQWDLMGHAVFF